MLAKSFAIVFVTVLMAEVGDKTQLTTMLFASSAALVAAATIGVLVGSQLKRIISPSNLKIVAGIGFILVGAWTLVVKGTYARRTLGLPTEASTDVTSALSSAR